MIRRRKILKKICIGKWRGCKVIPLNPRMDVHEGRRPEASIIHSSIYGNLWLYLNTHIVFVFVFQVLILKMDFSPFMHDVLSNERGRITPYECWCECDVILYIYIYSTRRLLLLLPQICKNISLLFAKCFAVNPQKIFLIPLKHTHFSWLFVIFYIMFYVFFEKKVSET